MSGCTAECWESKDCPKCGREMNPRGRSVPYEMACTDNECPARDHTINKRHLWSEHDSDRACGDKPGWDEHVANCGMCRDAGY